MRVLLTGSSGWLGRFLAPRLRAAGHVAIGLDVAPGTDTHVVGSAADLVLWPASAGRHRLSLVAADGTILDTVGFVVRGAGLDTSVGTPDPAP